MGERAVQLVILCRLFVFRFRRRRGNWHVTSRRRIDNIDSEFSQTSLVFLFIFYLVFLILLNGGIRHFSQESIDLLDGVGIWHGGVLGVHESPMGT